MAATLEAAPSTKTVEKLTVKSEAGAARELVRMAKEQGLALTGPDGLLKQLTKTVIETALDEELTEHLGYERHNTAAKDTANSRNGTRPKTVLTETTGRTAARRPRPGHGTRRSADYGPRRRPGMVLGHRRRGRAGGRAVLVGAAAGRAPCCCRRGRPPDQRTEAGAPLADSEGARSSGSGTPVRSASVEAQALVGIRT